MSAPAHLAEAEAEVRSPKSEVRSKLEARKPKASPLRAPWSAATCRRFFSGRLVARVGVTSPADQKRGQVRALQTTVAAGSGVRRLVAAFSPGDLSPSAAGQVPPQKSADKSAHSKAIGFRLYTSVFLRASALNRPPPPPTPSALGLRISFVIRHSSFVIPADAP